MCCPTLAGSGMKVWLTTRTVLAGIRVPARFLPRDLTQRRKDAKKRNTYLTFLLGDFAPLRELNAICLSLAGHLVVDPAIGLFHSYAQLGIGFPVHQLFDQGVVAVAAVD